MDSYFKKVKIFNNNFIINILISKWKFIFSSKEDSLLYELIFIKIKNLSLSPYSDKWIIMAAFNHPFPSLINLLNILEDWKMEEIELFQ